MEMWASHYGSEAGVMGLRLIPTGGLFLAGGMTPKNLLHLQVGYSDVALLISLETERASVTTAVRSIFSLTYVPS